MNLLIRADSSSQIGLGHIMRDLVLAETYGGENITFACRDLPGNIIDKIPYPVHILASDTPEELIETIRSRAIDMVIMDHYGIDAAYEQKIKLETGVTLLCLDDTYQPHHCDILLNPNRYAQSERYASLVPQHCELRCGVSLIRKEFKIAKQHPKPPTDALFIAMGGSDPANLSGQILEVLASDTKIHLVTTSSNPHLETLQRYTARFPNLHIHLNAGNIAEVMQQCSFAIITPSTTAQEVMFMGLPFIAIQSADNQKEFTAYLQREGLSVMESFEPNAFSALLERLR